VLVRVAGRWLFWLGFLAAPGGVFVPSLTGRRIGVLGGAALLLGWRPEGSPLWVLAITLLGAAAFIGIALLLGGTLRAEAVLAVANLLWLVFVLVGGVIVPLDQAPEMLRTIGELTPPGAMSQALRAVLQDGAAPPAVSLLVLVGWIVVGWAATVRWFRWQ